MCKGIDRDLIRIWSRHLPGGAEEIDGKLQNYRYFGRDSKLVPPEYKVSLLDSDIQGVLNLEFDLRGEIHIHFSIFFLL
jgi:hypothetical protein